MKQLFLCITFLFLSANFFGQAPKTLTPTEKVFGLSKFWQEVNYNFVYLEKVDRTMWDNRYKELITIVQNTDNDYEYYRELQKFCALLKDGHTNVYFPSTIQQYNTMFKGYQLFVENIDDKAIIVRTNYSKKDEVPIGSEIVEVNGLPTQKYIQKYVAPYISSSTDYVLKDKSISRLLTGLKGDTFNIKIKKPDREVLYLTLLHDDIEEKEFNPPIELNKEVFEFKWLKNGIAYLALNSFNDEKINALFIRQLPELSKAKGLIIDLRQNGGGNTNIGRDIFQYFTNDTILYGSKTSSRLHIPAFKAWGKNITAIQSLSSPWAKQGYLTYRDKYYHDFEYNPDTVKSDIKRIVVPTAILIGHNTASAAEDFLIYADNQKHMVKIGQNSFGSTGQPYVFDLPGGGSARVCTKKDTYRDGREFVGYGVKPDIVINPTLTDFINNTDPVLTRAIEYLDKTAANTGTKVQ
jgi:C-terminal processing protease CtpA/Prc